MKTIFGVIPPLLAPLVIFLSACSTPSVNLHSNQLFHDDFFKMPSKPIDSAEIFALSDEMARYIESDFRKDINTNGLRKGLFEALGRRAEMKIDYDATVTKNAADTFRTRLGNCLSLVIMTSAFAKNLGINVTYQQVQSQATWSRYGGLQFASGHVNIILGKRRDTSGAWRVLQDSSLGETLIVDFQPSNELQNERADPIDEQRVIAMYMNNRAAELMSEQQNDLAYWYTRKSLENDPHFMSALNTLGVLYQNTGHLPEVEQVYRQLLTYERNVNTLHNLINVLQQLKRDNEAAALSAELSRIQPFPPFYFLDQGIKAMDLADYQTAKQLFMKELERDPYYHELHFWLAIAHLKLNELPQAKEQLERAKAESLTSQQAAIYGAKLARLQASVKSSATPQSRAQ
jgi:tetratricopeptide (TPR) repeat protein